MDRRIFCILALLIFGFLQGTAFGDPITYFTNDDPIAMENALVNYIDNATTTVYCAIYGFDLVAVEQALIDAYNRLLPTNPNDPVRVVTDLDTYNDNTAPGVFKPHFQALESAGIIVVKDDKSTLMHNKFFVIDGHIVWTGSTNITDAGFYSNMNNAIVFDSIELAGYYDTEFTQMWDYHNFGTDKMISSVNTMTYNGFPLDFYFSPKDSALDAVISEVNNASESIYFSIFFFTYDALRDAIIARHGLGVTVVGIWDALGEQNYYSEDEALCDAGIPIKIETFSGLNHNKFMVIDVNDTDPRVITGSMNWTNNGTNGNDENTLIIHDPVTATEYKSQFDAMYNALDPSTLCVVGAPGTALNFNLEKDGTSITFSFDYVSDTTSFHIYGVQDETSMDNGDYLVKIEDLEYNPYGTWVLDDPQAPTLVEWTLTDGSLIPNCNYVVVGENNEGEGPYGKKSDGSVRVQHLYGTYGTPPICIGCASDPVPGDLVINEILADPAGDANGDSVIDTADDEFVEIVNISEVRLNLTGYTFSDLLSVRHIFPNGSYLDPCQAAVVFGGGTPTGSFGGSLVQVASTGWLSLNNTSESVTLESASEVIDMVTYGSEAGADVSIVRDPEATPGAPFVKSDTVGAMLDFTPGYMSDGVTSCFYSSCAICSASIDSVTPGTTVCVDVQVDFTGSGTGEGALTYEWDLNYTGVFTPDLAGTSISHTFTSPGIVTVAFRVTDSCDTPGPQNAIDTVDITINTCVSQCSDLRINEVDPNQTGTDTAEFVELHNATGAAIDFDSGPDSWVFVFFNGGDSMTDYAKNMTGSIADDGFFVIGQSTVIPAPDMTFPSGTLQNSEEAVAIFKGVGCTSADFPDNLRLFEIPGHCNLVDFLVYNAPDTDQLMIDFGQTIQRDDTTTESIQRYPDSNATDDPACTLGGDANWIQYAPTNGVSNGGCAAIGALIDTVTPGVAVCLGTPQNFTGSGIGQGTLTYEWDFDYDGITFDVMDSGTSVSYTYPGLGPYQAAFRVTDSCASPGPQEAIDAVAITINDCCALNTASIYTVSPSHAVCVTTQQTFNGSGTGDGALTYEWDFDYDGVTFDIMDSGTTVNYTYASAGAYTAALRVTDSCVDPGPQTAIDIVPLLVSSCSGNCPDVTINEIDSDTPSVDTLEFIELHNDTGTVIDLAVDGYVLVLFDGGDDASYRADDMTGIIADQGFYLIGNTGVIPAPDQTFPNGTMHQLNVSAVALYRGVNCTSAEFPTDTPAALTVGECGLVDAVIYHTNDADDPDLQAALGQTEQINESYNGSPSTDSIQRILDSQGCPMGWVTPNWEVSGPTPGISNTACPTASATISSVTPDVTVCQGIEQTFDGSGTGDGTLTYEWDFDYIAPTFDVDATGQTVNHTYPGIGTPTAALRITDSCTNPGPQTAIDTVLITINDCCTIPTASIYTITPGQTVCQGTQQDFTGSATGEGTLTLEWDLDYDGVTFDIDASGTTASITYASAGNYVVAFRMTDTCADPGQQTAIDTKPIVVNSCGGACNDITINEIDCDTTSVDTLEFVEFHNATDGSIGLGTDHYVMVFFDGGDDASYYAQDLTGSIAQDGFHLVGNANVIPAPDQLFDDDKMQNGTDAVALYRGRNCAATEFPSNTPAAQSMGECLLVDAIVYHTGDTDDVDLRNALGVTEAIDEDFNGSKDTESIQRILDSQGCPMGWETPNWEVSGPTPGISNSSCATISSTIVSVLPSASICQGEQQDFSGSGTGEGTLTYEWDYDYDFITFTVDATGQDVSYTYAATGTYTAALRVTDSCSNPGPQEDIDTISISINDCCTAVSATIDTVTPGYSVCQGIQQTFSGLGGGEGTLTFEWDFDYDGVTFNVADSGQSVNKTYATAGSYTAALRVTDSCGDPGPQQAIDTVPIIINSCGGTCPDITINETDADQTGGDVAEFVELHNDSDALVDLAGDGYVLVFYDGNDNASYYATDLFGSIPIDGFYLIGNAGVVPDQSFSDGLMQNGADGVAIYRGFNCSSAEFPNNTTASDVIGACALVDAICYDTNDDDATTLMTALGVTEQINEDENNFSSLESIQRITDSQGCPMGFVTPNWEVSGPTPGYSNTLCTAPTAMIDSVTPSATVCQGTQQTFTGSGYGEGTLTYEWDFDYDFITFTVDATGQSVNNTYIPLGPFTAALRVTDSCSTPGPQSAIDTISIQIDDCCALISASIDDISPAATVCSGTLQTFTGSGTGEGGLTYEWDFTYDGATFNVDDSGLIADYQYGGAGMYTVAFRVTDSCADPVPQQAMDINAVVVNSCSGTCSDITINEIDPDQVDPDTTEFVEFHNNTGSFINLGNNYVLVFFNGWTDTSYYSVDLTGTMLNNAFYTVGNAGVVPAPNQTFPDGILQDGADAVALYRGENCSALDFDSTPAAVTYANCTLVDVVVYGDPAFIDTSLLDALGQTEQVDEGFGLNSDGESLQRTTDSQGCAMGWVTPNWKTAAPTSRASNN